MLYLTASSKYNKTPSSSIMTQILSRFFKGILFQVWITLCSQEQRQETQNGTRVILHLHRARLNIKGWQRDIGGTLLLGVFFRLVGCFFESSSYCNDPLPAPAVNLLGFYMKKASKTQTTSWMAEAFSPHQKHRRLESSSSYDHLSLTIYHQKIADLFRIKSQPAVQPYHRHPPHLKGGPR